MERPDIGNAAWRVAGTERLVNGDEAARFVTDSIRTGVLDVRFERGDEQSLSVTTNGERAMLILWGRRGWDEGIRAVDPGAGEASHGGYVLQNGQQDTYPDVGTVPLDHAIAAVRHIVMTGEADPRLQWERW